MKMPKEKKSKAYLIEDGDDYAAMCETTLEDGGFARSCFQRSERAPSDPIARVLDFLDHYCSCKRKHEYA